MPEIVDQIEERRTNGPLPGLIGGWDGPIVITCSDGFPCLIPATAEPPLEEVPDDGAQRVRLPA